MNIVVIGATGWIGKKLVYNLRQADHRVLRASPSCGVDTVTGEGLYSALRGAEVVVDVSNSPAIDGDAPVHFFETSGMNLLAAEIMSSVQHHIALSIVGTDGLLDSSYFRAKKVQEDLIKASGIPYTILRSTQFFEIISAISQVGSSTDVLIPDTLVQPLSSEDLATALADIVLSEPVDRTIEIAGPERFPLGELATAVLTAYEDTRRIISDGQTPYLGAHLRKDSLLPARDAILTRQRFEDWLRDSVIAGYGIQANA